MKVIKDQSKASSSVGVKKDAKSRVDLEKTKSGQLIAIRLVMYCLLIFLTAFVVYSNTIEHDFTVNDQSVVVENKNVIGDQQQVDLDITESNINNNDNDNLYNIIYHQATLSLGNLLNYNYRGENISKSISDKTLFRPLTTISFRLNFLSNGLEPFIYHFWNIFLHCLNSIYVFVLSFILVTSFPTTSSNSKEITSLIPAKSKFERLSSFSIADEISCLIAGLIFAVHPIHTEAVSSVYGRSELLGTTFYILSLFTFVRGIMGGNGHLGKTMVLFLLACLSNESVFFLIVFYPLLDLLLFFSLSINSTSMFVFQVAKFSKSQWRKGMVKRVVIFFLIAILYISFRVWFTPNGSIFNSNYRELDNPIGKHPIYINRLLSNMYIHFKYLSLLLVPSQLSVDYSFNCIPLIESITDTRNIYSIATYLSLFALVLVSMMKSNLYAFVKSIREKKNKDLNISLNSVNYWILVLLSIMFMMISFLPFSNIFFYMATLISERYLYISSIGFSILISRILVLPLIGKDEVLLIQNDKIDDEYDEKDDKNNEKSKKDNSNISNNNKNIIKNRNIKEEKNKKNGKDKEENQLKELKKLIKLQDKYMNDNSSDDDNNNNSSSNNDKSKLSTNIKRINNNENSNNNSLKLFITIISLIILSSIYSIQTWNRNLDWENSLKLYSSAEKVCANSARVHFNLGMVYKDSNEYDKAILSFQKAQEIYSDYCEVELHYSLAILYKDGNYVEAIPRLKKSLDCKYTDSNVAYSALSEIYQFLTEKQPNNITLYQEWADVEQRFNPILTSTLLYEIGVIEQEVNENFESSIKYFLRSLVALKKETSQHYVDQSGGNNQIRLTQEAIDEKKKELICQNHMWIGRAFKKIENDKKAIEYLEKVVKDCKDQGIWSEAHQSLRQLKSPLKNT
ncbi:hypothetical protein CYY_001239 [Polysphondylium violaceum]|uniref:dolichyl-phosphate-mannose--protein mannosyltransferase n=1 Tax=Polysphondylium violaceum TaxID=133409 RepID=A0A8J4Q0F6_9MYCE|nr:hypothetical protein CYY_001239 [Polysphondylium violaceum]